MCGSAACDHYGTYDKGHGPARYEQDNADLGNSPHEKDSGANQDATLDTSEKNPNNGAPTLSSARKVELQQETLIPIPDSWAKARSWRKIEGLSQDDKWELRVSKQPTRAHIANDTTKATVRKLRAQYLVAGVNWSDQDQGKIDAFMAAVSVRCLRANTS